MSTTPEFVTARTPEMRGLWLGQECGHVILNAGRPEGSHCYACDPEYLNLDLRVTWLKLYIRSADRVQHQPPCPAATGGTECDCTPIRTVSTALGEAPLTYTSALEVVTKTVKETKKKADIAANVVDALCDAGYLVSFGDDVTVYLDESRLSPTHTVDTDEGVTVEYRGDRVLSYRFPAGTVVEVGS